MAANANWIGTWAGGRIQEGKRGKTYWIEKSVRGHRYSIRLVGCGEREAIAEYKLFAPDPENYKPRHVRDAERLREAEAAALAAEEAALEQAEVARVAEVQAAAEDAAKLRITEDLVEDFHAALVKGYDARGPRDERHADKTRRALLDWSKHPVLKGRDVRTVTLGELRKALDGWNDQKGRIAAIKALTRWLRWSDKLKRSEDPTLDLQCIQASDPTPAENAAKVYSIELLELTYRHIANQDVRDLFWIRVHCGLHESEVKRISRGECVVQRVEGQGEIAAVVEVEHKSGEPHRQSVDAATLARVERLMKLGGRWPTEKTLAANRRKAAEKAREDLAKRRANGEIVPKLDVREVYMGHLRACRTTLAEELGTVVQPTTAKRGVPLEMIARSHGHSPETARRFYSGRAIPPMITIPVNLVHPSDPPVETDAT